MNLFTPELIDRLASADRIAVLTGAGASAESGIPTFRGPEGLWSNFRPEELASFEAFRRDPIRVQSWYSMRRRAVLEAEPNACHLALARLEELVPSVTIVTQNVDRLHHRAGSSNVIELHGNLVDTYCVSCGHPADTLDVDPDAVEPARCPCGGLLRPAVVWFGEALPVEAHDAAVHATTRCDVFLCIGTSAEVYPAAGLPAIASEYGSYVTEINVRRTAISDRVDELVMSPAGTAMDVLVKLVRDRSHVGTEES